jgi:hypothetical protein
MPERRTPCSPNRKSGNQYYAIANRSPDQVRLSRCHPNRVQARHPDIAKRKGQDASGVPETVSKHGVLSQSPNTRAHWRPAEIPQVPEAGDLYRTKARRSFSCEHCGYQIYRPPGRRSKAPTRRCVTGSTHVAVQRVTERRGSEGGPTAIRRDL